MHNMQKLCRNYAKKIMQKLCKNYAKIMQKLCKNYAMFPDCIIMHALCKNYANYAKIMQIMQVSKNYANYASPTLLMVRCGRLCFAALPALGFPIDCQSTVDRQSIYRLRGSEKLALETERARFQGALKSQKCLRSLEMTFIYMQLCQSELVVVVSGSGPSPLCKIWRAGSIDQGK